MNGGKSIIHGKGEVRKVIFGILITIPFLIIIIPILMSSDMVFKEISFDLLSNIKITWDIFFRICFCLVCSSYLYVFWIDDKFDISKPIQGEEKEESIMSQFYISIQTFLVIINIIYGLFVYVQIKYLFINNGSLPFGITYSQYAREGFFQLIVIVGINVLLILITEFINKDKKIFIRILEVLTLLMTFIMSISAYYRMILYQQHAGYTRLRLLVFIFLIFIGILIIFMGAYLVTYKKILINVIFAYIVIFYVGVNWFNFDGFIAKKNIERYNATGKIDEAYLFALSSDAYEDIMEYVLNRDTINKKRVDNLQKSYQIEEDKDFRKYNYSKSKASKLYNEKLKR